MLTFLHVAWNLQIIDILGAGCGPCNCQSTSEIDEGCLYLSEIDYEGLHTNTKVVSIEGDGLWPKELIGIFGYASCLLFVTCISEVGNLLVYGKVTFMGGACGLFIA